MERRVECNASISMADKLNLGSDEGVAVMCQFCEFKESLREVDRPLRRAMLEMAPKAD